MFITLSQSHDELMTEVWHASNTWNVASACDYETPEGVQVSEKCGCLQLM